MAVSGQSRASFCYRHGVRVVIGREGFKFETSPRSARGTVGGTNKPHCARCQASECSDGVGKGKTGTRGTEVVVIEGVDASLRERVS
jgi:hypothetical protein